MGQPGGREPFNPIVCIVDFHHARGPEVETWIGVEQGRDPAAENDWSLLPFMALSDGAHAATEDFSYFTLRQAPLDEGDHGRRQPATSLFGVACTRQLDASTLLNRPAEVTRSTVQKAVVVIADGPQHFAQLREKLSIVTRAWFAQRDFRDMQILRDFQESLAKSFRDQEGLRDQYFGLSLRELIYEYKHQVLVLFKCCLLQPKMLFFGSNCEHLCMIQFALISLIPSLLRNLQDCADPQFNTYEENLTMPTNLRTSERASLLAYMGLPLQIFGEGSLFGPYTPLQQLDLLADYGTKSYVVGSTNSLLLQQKDRYSDILINLDDRTINISSTSLRTALTLTTPDRRWMDFLTQAVVETWDEDNPGRPKTMGYAGSEEFIRLQFEEYLLALLAAIKYRLYVEKNKEGARALLDTVEGDPSKEFGFDWVEAWMKTGNFRMFHQNTDSHLFDIVEPLHPCSGGLTMEDVQRRLAQQVSELHLDERFRSGRDALNQHLATGQKKVSTAFNNLWADIEELREAQRRRADEQKRAAASSAAPVSPTAPVPNGDRRPAASAASARFSGQGPAPAAGATANASSRAGAYLSSWGAWAAEKRRGAWGARSTASNPQTPVTSPPPTPVRMGVAEKTGGSAGMSERGERATEKGERVTAKGEGMAEGDERMAEKSEGMTEKSEGMTKQGEGMTERK